jgi:O-antigen/teichoic acid export membrane protein
MAIPAFLRESWTSPRSRNAASLFRDGGLSLLDQMVASATTFLTGVLIGRVCAKEDFGYYMLGFSLFTFLMTLQNALVNTPYTIYFPRLGQAAARRFTGSALLHQLALSSCVAVAIGGGALVSHVSGAPSSMTAMLLGLATAISFLLLRDFIRQVCFARLAMTRALLFDLVIAAGQLASLSALAVTGMLDAATAFLALGFVCAIAAGGIYAASRHELAIDVRHAAQDFRNNWQSAKWLFASGIVWSISMNLYAWLVAGFHGAASAGAWAAALGAVTILNPLMLGAQNFLGPRIMHARASGGISALDTAVWRTCIGYAGSLAALGVVLMFAGDYLVVLIYGAKYAGNGAIVSLLALNLACNALGFSFSRGLFALDQAAVDFKVNFVALVAMVLCGIWLARAYGPWGAALGQLVTNCIASGTRAAAYIACYRKAAAVEAT